MKWSVCYSENKDYQILTLVLKLAVLENFEKVFNLGFSQLFETTPIPTRYHLKNDKIGLNEYKVPNLMCYDFNACACNTFLHN